MEIRSGGTLLSFRGFLGGNTGAVGSALVTDAKSKWTASGSIWVGNSGSGTPGRSQRRSDKQRRERLPCFCK